MFSNMLVPLSAIGSLTAVRELFVWAPDGLQGIGHWKAALTVVSSSAALVGIWSVNLIARPTGVPVPRDDRRAGCRDMSSI